MFDIDLFFLISVFVTGWVGYRLAEYYRLQPLAGFALGAFVNAVFAADTTIFGQRVLGAADVRVLWVAFGLLLLLSLFALAGKGNSIRVLKVTAIVGTMAFAFDQLPRPSRPSERPARAVGITLPDSISFDFVARSSLPSRLLAAIDGPSFGFRTLARVTGQTPLYFGIGPEPVSGRRTVRRGDWVLVRRTVSDRQGREWAEVLVSDEEGNYEEGTSNVGFVPAESLSFHVPVPAIAD